MSYLIRPTDTVAKQLKKIAKKKHAVYNELLKRLSEISENPYKYKPLGNVLTGQRRVHIATSFVLRYAVDEATKTVWLIRFGHHDEAY